MVLSGMLVPASPFRTLDGKTTPSSGSPVVTKRQSAMTSLRASAVLAKAGIIDNAGQQ
jgi:hypothetical protein